MGGGGGGVNNKTYGDIVSSPPFDRQSLSTVFPLHFSPFLVEIFPGQRLFGGFVARNILRFVMTLSFILCLFALAGFALHHEMAFIVAKSVVAPFEEVRGDVLRQRYRSWFPHSEAVVLTAGFFRSSGADCLFFF